MAGRVNVASKIKLQTVEQLLGVPDIAGTSEIEVDKIYPFKDHPFKVLDDEKMDDLVSSIKLNGVLNPVIVRPSNSGHYEMISGHRRLHASKLAGLQKIPAIIKEMTDDESVIVMVDANIQREEILPSEKAFALRMKLEAVKHQGTSRTECEKQKAGELSCYEVGEGYGLKGRQVLKYIRLTYLSPVLLELIDAKKIGISMGADISYFDSEVQTWIYEYIKDNGFLKPQQVEILKEQKNLSNMTQYIVISLMNSALPEKKPSAKVSLSEKKLNQYFPPHYSARQREEVILKLLKQWKAGQEEGR